MPLYSYGGKLLGAAGSTPWSCDSCPCVECTLSNCVSELEECETCCSGWLNATPNKVRVQVGPTPTAYGCVVCDGIAYQASGFNWGAGGTLGWDLTHDGLCSWSGDAGTMTVKIWMLGSCVGDPSFTIDMDCTVKLEKKRNPTTGLLYFELSFYAINGGQTYYAWHGYSGDGIPADCYLYNNVSGIIRGYDVCMNDTEPIMYYDGEGFVYWCSCLCPTDCSSCDANIIFTVSGCTGGGSIMNRSYTATRLGSSCTWTGFSYNPEDESVYTWRCLCTGASQWMFQVDYAGPAGFYTKTFYTSQPACVVPCPDTGWIWTNDGSCTVVVT